MKHLYHLVITFLLLLTACGCDSGRRNGSTLPTLAVSIEPQRYLLERIAGDKFNIVTMLPPDADPENYEPTLGLLKKLNNSKIYFAVGNMPFEEQLLARSRMAENGNTEIVTAAALQDITSTHDHPDSHEHHAATDPHVWTSPANSLAIARQMLEAVVRIDPGNEAVYRQRFNSLAQSIDSLNEAIANRLTPCEGDMMIVEHPSLSYFARDYGLKQLYFGAENKEITPNRLRSVIDSATTHSHAVTMVCEAAYNADRTRSIARQAGAPTVEINTLSHDFLSQLDELSIKLANSHHAHDQSTVR